MLTYFVLAPADALDVAVFGRSYVMSATVDSVILWSNGIISLDDAMTILFHIESQRRNDANDQPKPE